MYTDFVAERLYVVYITSALARLKYTEINVPWHSMAVIVTLGIDQISLYT